MAVIDISQVTNVTLYTGDNGSGACTCSCPACSQKGRERRYQGTVEQADKMFALLPNLEHIYVLGNPDPSVDAKFCNLVMREAVKRKIKVAFSTSGIGGEKVIKTLLKNIPPEMVDYCSFSYDSTTSEGMSLYKGVNYPMEYSLSGLDWAITNKYTVKVQPTLWNSNYKNVEEIIKFFRARGVKWFTFHVGSLEAGVYLPTHKHITEYQLESVHRQIDIVARTHPEIKVRCPDFFMHEVWDGKYYCMNPSSCVELMLCFEETGKIRATHAPIAASYTNKLSWNLGEEADVPKLKGCFKCPFSYRLTGRETKCRFLSKYWNY